jgi:hypothetical protein
MDNLTEINDIMSIAYKLDKSRYSLYDQIDLLSLTAENNEKIDFKQLNNIAEDIQNTVNMLITKSWNLYNKYYGDYKVK